MCARYVACEAKESPPALSLISSDPTSVMVSAELHPSLLVTAPEFSNCDDEEENCTAEPVNDSSKIKHKDAITIDDALASAFSGFLSSISIQSEKYSQTLAIRAPEFTSEEETRNGGTLSPKLHPQITATCFRQADETEGVRSSFLYLSDKSLLDGEKNVLGSLDDGSSVKMGEGVDEKKHEDGEECCSEGNFNGHADEPLQHDFKRIDSYQMTEDIRGEEACDGMSGTSVIKKANGLEELAVNQTNEGHNVTPESAILQEVMTSTEAAKERSNRDTLQNLSHFSCAACPVDFETQILDVKFISEENLNSKSPLEALLAGTPELILEVPSIEESGHDISQIGVGQGTLISMEDWGATISTNNGHIPVDMDYYNVTDVPFKVEGDKLQDYHSCSAQEMPAASLI
uniref:Uncharacterized protein n=1 Tax=Rhizophora mucronata TaxID=61149 RepID=A0A2P2JL96_RHIMU